LIERTVPVALFGNTGGAHSLVGHSGEDRSAFERIVWFTDRPPEVDGSEFPCIYAGYGIADGYVIQLTEPDDAAPRAGMVRTTAVLIPTDALHHIRLAPAFALIATLTEPRPVRLSELIGDGSPVNPPGSGALADALIRVPTVLWIGDGFEAAVDRVWAALSADDRNRVTFGTAVHRDGVSIPRPDEALVVLRTAERYASRWDWPQVTASDEGPRTAAGRALLGYDAEVRRLAEELMQTPPRLDQWRHVAAAQSRLDHLHDLNHEATRALAQLVCLLAPNPHHGLTIKERVANRLRELTPRSGFDDVRGLRNIRWDQLSQGIDVNALLYEWADEVWRDPDRVDDLATALIAYDDDGDEFVGAVHAELLRAAAATPAAAEVKVSAALAQPDSRVASWLTNVSKPSVLDPAFATAAGDHVPPWLVDFAREHRLPLTHATVMPVTDPIAAWKAHLRIPSRSRRAGDLLAERVGPQGTVAAAIAIGHEGLVRRGGSLVAAAPELLPRTAAKLPEARRVWVAAIEEGADPWATLQPNEAAETLLDELLHGGTVDPVLLRALADSAAADISAHPRRAELWKLLPENLRDSFLAASAATVASSIVPAGPLPERELQQVILGPGVLAPLARRDPGQALTVLECLSAADAEAAMIVLRTGRFDRRGAERLGELVVKRRWKHVAEALAEAEAVRDDLQPAADRAQVLLGIFDRLTRAFGLGRSVRAVAGPEELSAALLEAAVDLYPRGPMQAALWERAGGKEADAPQARTGREMWRAALTDLQAGATGTPRTSALLSVMLDDYPKNRELAALAAAMEEQSG
jgi:hypothetical protein